MTSYSLLPPFVITVHEGQNAARNAHNDLFAVELWKNPGACWSAIMAQEIFECRYKWRRFLFFADRREMELLGHAVEARVARELGYDLDQYEKDEAAAMVQGYSAFAGLTVQEVQAQLLARRGEALRWVSDNRRLVDAWKALLR